ncbi:nicotinate-nucleotide--dimethylbenzimidazole phosphoribosyltransferase [Dyadobacter fanqingshengii]|uniref:Nicotinate-nucleotide--dimethylbenzimidazole phosphoribosyltransferase n=1 Tax=Dyadobacter fanqingshengii TaxID=2906443 RepID=A0A9X1PAT3_9BACT|nr:nicotinate-nucleotide--dimethylbenzimidazole phosphoribosyltransferase [Dyadobacter fanqingshengii]MCF0040498.1 nicotinate-nucleotide--dimethylbenzimidazole phosphoribosyltransferase [Dyadobacter fanqingshengii]USJ37760.1 nicotinate-nucleotide--dimethylbenzimidazole phosphoribosyltransferase [Dyadobacter fanqingshengii]
MNVIFADQIQRKIDFKTKPQGALGTLEKLAFQIASIQGTLTPELIKPHIIVFAASHGIAASGVSAYPAEVTAQMVLNFIHGGAAINVFTRQNGITLQVVDAGVDYDFGKNEKLMDAKVGFGTKNFLLSPAMTAAELDKCLRRGREIVARVQATGCNVIGFGEMGIGNTSSASLIMSKLLDVPLEDCVGQGTGLKHEQLSAKLAILREAMQNHADIGSDPLSVLQTFGGFEIAMMCGAMLEAADRRMIVMVDGFIASVAYLCAFRMNAVISEYSIFCHESTEKGHECLLRHLKVEPVLHLGMRLGEGTGCAVAYPILQSAVAFFNDMASFESAGVSNKSL